jgi:hydroxypyruvate reductase
VAAVDAERLVAASLAREIDFLTASTRHPSVWLLAVGKAAPGMAHAATQTLGAQLRGGLVVSAHDNNAPSVLDRIEGEHPVPGAGSERAGRRALALARSAGAADVLLVLLSGGASAMMAVPADGLALDDKRRVTEQLLRSGADIHSLNVVRKHLSAIKGGRLAAASPAWCVTLAISDVVGDDLSVIGSGPTVGDSSRFDDALAVLDRHAGLERYPANVVAFLRRGAEGRVEETPKPGDSRLRRATARVVGSRLDAMRGVAELARARGYHVVEVPEPIVGEARESAGVWLQQCLARAAPVERPACVISSGETTVDVRGAGRGGRNQEFAIALAEPLAALGHAAAVSAGTDGLDGPTDAAGAYVDSQTLQRARSRGVGPPAAFLQDNDTYEFFALLGDLVLTGATGTNVGDLQVLLLAN